MEDGGSRGREMRSYQSLPSHSFLTHSCLPPTPYAVYLRVIGRPSLSVNQLLCRYAKYASPASLLRWSLPRIMILFVSHSHGPVFSRINIPHSPPTSSV